jgi:hypothetical protein
VLVRDLEAALLDRCDDREQGLQLAGYRRAAGVGAHLVHERRAIRQLRCRGG